MQDPYELVGAILIVAVAGIMLVAGELYLVTKTDTASMPSPRPAAVISSR
jgi:hypothetical protein